MEIAGAWSIDPTTLHLLESSSPAGVVGTIAA